MSKKERISVVANTMLLKGFDVVCFTETWLTSEIHDKEPYLGKHKVFEADRLTPINRTKHGGVLIGLAKNILFEKLTLNINAKVKAVKVF